MVKIGVIGLTGCSGCQCEILNCQDALLKLLSKVEISLFPLAKDDNLEDELDLLFVEGSVSTSLDRDWLLRLRERTKVLVAVGSCACYGGVQAQRNDEVQIEEMVKEVYGSWKLPFEVFKPSPVSEFVKVDYFLPGCPLDKKQFVYTVSFLLNGVKPFFPKIPVCHECKLSENECLLLKGIPCQGPVTYAGCGAPCTSKGVGCQGCRGDCDFPNHEEIISILTKKGLSYEDALKFLKVFRGNTFRVRRVDEKGA
ncbi:sulfhydrogenase delta subunit [Thermovibrio guaymasensis]|uniref:Sulfhydrogenase delta subunit n=1 Tax=Thermovibrio guaymasensis TaxID=240167 RepID=A0A420W8C0_9BACT|nr:NADH:ubiquinone oxidoreductase [Thermovibrio guaymasensis]RKQ63561.1 sulfhydrogenase delta subunit [Thermovibrio guaymasensis]